MARYMLKSFLRRTLNCLLREYLQQKNALQDFQWSQIDSDGNKIPLPETSIDELYDAIGELGNNEFLQINQEFHDIFCMSDDGGIGCMIEMGSKRRFCVDLVEEFDQNGIEGPFDRAMWVFLRHNDLFKYVFKFMELVTTQGVREFYLGEISSYRDGKETRNELKEAVVSHYKRQGKGKNCIIDDYVSGQGDNKQYCYYIYQQDSIKKVLDFNEDGTEVIRKPQRSIFDNIFFFEPASGKLRIHAAREKNTTQLADIFCRIILELPGRPNADIEYYSLAKVKNPNFSFISNKISRVNVTEVICDIGNDEEVILKAPSKEQKGLLLLERMRALAAAYGISMADIIVKKIRFQVVFSDSLKLKPRTREIVLPNRSDLGNDRSDNIIRQHVEDIWGLTCNSIFQESSYGLAAAS